MPVWMILAIIVVAAVLLSIGIERVIARLGVRPVDPDAARGGMSRIAEGLQEWSQRRSRDE